RTIPGLGRDTDVNCRPLVEPPEELGALEWPSAPARLSPGGCVNWIRLHEPVALLPKANFARVAIKPSIGDDAVSVRQAARQHGRLRRAGDARQDSAQRQALASL